MGDVALNDVDSSEVAKESGKRLLAKDSRAVHFFESRAHSQEERIRTSTTG